jgi:hypothetical protein
MEQHQINIHPADELAALREEIKQMQVREEELRALLLAPGADLVGDQYTAALVPGTRETVDKNALIAELGRPAIERFLKTSAFKSVKLIPKS